MTDTQTLVAEMREAGEGRTDGPWTFQASEPECEEYASYHVFDGNDYSLLSDEQYYPIAPSNTRDARFIAYAGTHWNTIADMLEAQATQLAEAQAEIERLRNALINLNAPIHKMWNDWSGCIIDEKHVRAISEAQVAADAVLYKDKTKAEVWQMLRDTMPPAREALNKDKTDD